MSPRESRRPGACPSRKNLSLTLVALATLGASSGAFAANECQAKYAFKLGSNSPVQTKTVNINKGSSVNIDAIEGNKVLYVLNMKSTTIRVYRSGIGSYIDLPDDGRDPLSPMTYSDEVTLQKIACLEDSAASTLSIQQLVATAFQAVSQATLGGVNGVAGMINNVNGWAKKTATDWGSCPSSGAQAAYNQAKGFRSQIDSLLTQAQGIKAEADTALATCLASTGNSPLCGATHSNLAVHGWIATLNTARATVISGMQTMAALKCPSGCAQQALLPVPYPDIKPGGAHRLTAPGMLNLEVCTNLDLGSIGFNPSAVASGNLPGIVKATAPSCTSTTKIPLCTDWDLDALLVELKRLNLVPPNLSAINLEIPIKKYTVVNGVKPASCRTPLKVCEPSGNLVISLNEGKELFDSAGSCKEFVEVGCQDPAFGLALATETVDGRDFTKAKVSWTKDAFGSITVDLTAPNFAKLCRGNDHRITIPKPPVVKMGTENVPLPFICTQPTFISVVANP